MVKIVTDTLSDIPVELAEKLGISVVPLNVHFGDETYRDGIDLTTEEFYRKLETSDVFPKTSAPGAGLFVELFNKLAQETDEILAIMTSSKISAIYQSALQAKAMMEKKCHIEVIDSLQVLAGQMFLVLEAAEAALAGANLTKVTRVVKQAMPRIHIRAAFDTLEYLKRGGRIGKAQAFLGGLLKITPVLGFKDGEAYPYARVRSRSQAIDFLVNFAKGFSKIDRLAVEDATTPDEAESMVERLSDTLPKEHIYRTKFSPVIGTHVGPHVLAVSLLGR
jgi:DegV family protein with EDD domain